MSSFKIIPVCFKYMPVLFFCVFIGDISAGQCDKSKLMEKVKAVEDNDTMSDDLKLKTFYDLKAEADKCRLPKDSVYARILHRIGVFEYFAKNYDTAINYTIKAIDINTGNAKDCSRQFALKSCTNLYLFYKNLMQVDKSLFYIDKTLKLAQTIPGNQQLIFSVLSDKNSLVFAKGDYQKSIDDNILNIAHAGEVKDTLYLAVFYNNLAQAYMFEDQPSPAKRFADSGYFYAFTCHNITEQANAAKIKALANADNNTFNDLVQAEVRLRAKSDHPEELAGDYIDFGNVFFNRYKQYDKAKAFYLKSLYYAVKFNDTQKQAIDNINLGLISFYNKEYAKASKYYGDAFDLLNLSGNRKGFLHNPALDQLEAVPNKELVLVLLNNKTEVLLNMFKENGNPDYLSASLVTALLTDSVITQMRHEQLGEQSKLYWRNRTHDFFNTAIEASYRANNADLAFRFMEKSRAVLLNDQLNEIGASTYLPPAELTKQENLQITISEFEQRLLALPDTSPQYRAVQFQLVDAKDKLNTYITSLETRYPVYYQYKYEDKVPSIADIRQYLKKNNQSFVHYFFGDTASYALAITATSTKFIRLTQNDFNIKRLSGFLQLCADKQALNNDYYAFAKLSNAIYTSLFKPLQLPGGRVIICLDKIIIPFDALCTDETGKHFLLNSYSFDYVYSARFLMKQFSSTTAKGSFAGFAPVSFNKSLKVVDLKNAANALNASASYYKKDKLFTHQNASRNNFFNYASSYSVVSIFSHAFADTTNNEPVLFMQDSTIHLSELQRLKEPSTKLVLLSACQTNVGKVATGEGIYSLARGFAAAGIPSVAATLWKADEQTIYSVSEKFNEYLSEGMNKDEALQKAKLYFIQNNTSDKMLPYYWANMILIGNTDAISFTITNSNHWWWIAGLVLLTAIIMSIRKKNLLLSKIKR